MRALSLASLLFAPLFFSGCSEEQSGCPDSSCPPSITISVVKVAGQFPRGSYSVITAADGAPDTCDLEIAGDTALGCPVFLFANTDQESLRFFHYYSLPEQFEFRLESGDSVLTDTTFNVTYEQIQLNGPECAACPLAFAQIAVP